MSRAGELREYVRLARVVLGPEVVLQPPVSKLSKPPENEVWISGPGGDIRKNAHILYVKELVRRVALQYKMELPSVKIRFSYSVAKAGSVQRRGDDWFIDVGSEYRNHAAQLIYIVAHEMAHILMAQRGVELTSVQRNEELTDTVAVLAGFGPIVLRAMEITTSQRNWEFVDGRYTEIEYIHTKRLGYLSRTDVSSISQVRHRLRDLKLRKRGSPVDTRIRPTLLCPCCRVRLQLPEVTSVVLIRCKLCSGEQMVRLHRSRNLFYGIVFTARHIPAWIIDRRGGFPD